MRSYVHDGSVGPWAQQKLDCLRAYLEEYTKILRRYHFSYFYVDAFSGAGEAPLRKYGVETDDHPMLFGDTIEEREYQRGSPYHALSTEHPFTGYLFIDNDSKNIQRLREFVHSRFPDRANRVKYAEGEANTLLRNKLLENPNINWDNSRAIIFLDPFATELRVPIIADLAHTGAVEVIINNTFPMSYNRLLKRGGGIPKSWESLLTEFFGTSDWKTITYTEQTDLFGENRIRKIDDATSRLARWYNQRLKEAFGYAAPPRIVRNTRNIPVYYLHWAGPKAVGHNIISHIMKQGETLN